ncbi:periplasmic binding protein [Desulfitobacterium hafniense DP7]|uniref:Periplasmic binding protein n=2 Tax=Desulfitobacterium hafniense TaxID=49338 RepID=G9XNR0_DESHA|nr:periplasmic binding protein [Desulfitobacterium hafniense DP7]
MKMRRMEMKKRLIMLMVLALAVFLSGCSSQSGGLENVAEETRTVKDMKGEVVIPANPLRIVDVSGSADELTIMGIPFIASANTSMFDGVTVPEYLQSYFAANKVEVVGNYSGTMDLNLEKIAELKPDLIIMNIRHEKVYEQLKAIAPTLMLSDDINFVNWRGRFQQLGQWFGKEAVVTQWLKDFDARAAELAQKVKEVAGGETFAAIEANSVHFGSYYAYRTAGPGELLFDEMELTPSAGVPEKVWGEVVDAEYFSRIDADHLFFFSDDGRPGETENSPAWQNLKAVQKGNVYYGVNGQQYDMAYTPKGKLLYMEKLAGAIINHTDVK